MKLSTRRRRAVLRTRWARHKKLQRLTPKQRHLLHTLEGLTPIMQAALWYRLEDMGLLEREDMQESLEQMRRGEYHRSDG